MKKNIKSLKSRTINSSAWVIAGHLLSQLIRFGGNLVLTRLLIPEMFGVMAIITVVMIGFAMFSDIGLLQNIVQSKRGDEASFLNTAWTIQILRGFFLFVLGIIVSAILYLAGQERWLPLNTVYDDPELPKILVIMSLTLLIAGFNSIYLMTLTRKLALSKTVSIDIFSQAIGLGYTIFLAWCQQNIWALVIGALVSPVIKMLLSHSSFIGERCQLQWDKEAVHEILNFGKWIFLSSILGFLLNQGDRLLLGGLISSEKLGVYTIAFFLANAIRDILQRLASSVFFPVLSETIREQPKRISEIYYKIRLKIDSITMFFAGFLFKTGYFFIDVFYDKRYEEAGWMLQILSLSLISVGFSLSNQCFLAYGQARLNSISTGIQTLTLYIFVPLVFTYYGFKAVIWVIAINPMINILISSTMMKRYHFLNMYKEIFMLPMFGVGYGIGYLSNYLIFIQIKMY